MTQLSPVAPEALALTGATPFDDSLITAARAAAANHVFAPAERLGACGAALGVSVHALADVRAALADAHVDVNPFAEAPMLKRLLVADMDSTIIAVECIDELAAEIGVGAEVAGITERAMRGELDFEGALEARVRLLEGASTEILRRTYETRVRLNPGARTMTRTMERHGAVTALLSGGFTFFSERVARAAGFSQHQANRLLMDAGRLTGEVARPILGPSAKRAALEQLARSNGRRREETVAIGDGANDIEMIREASFGVAYRAKPVLAKVADARLDHSDLTALLYLQGLPESAFVLD